MNDNAALSVMSPPKTNEPAEVMRDNTSQLESFERKLAEYSGYFTWPDVEKHRKEFGGSRITECGVTYEYGTHPLAALAMRERAAAYMENPNHQGIRPTWASDIRALPTTFTDADLLAAAMRLPEVRALVDALERIGGIRGPYSFPFPETHADYGPFAVMEAREALAPFTNIVRK